jgi:integrase
MTKIDPYKSKQAYLNWKSRVKEGIPNITKESSEIIKQYLEDMEIGRNVAISNKKGSRSFIRLNTLRLKIVFLVRQFESRYNLEYITKIKEEQILNFFTDMRNGLIKKRNGENYKAVRDYAKMFKAFWHWHQRSSRKKGVLIEDITVDLDTSGEKPKWVYLTEGQVMSLANNANNKYKTLILFLLDTGIRSPTELVNVKVEDLSENYKTLHIKISKTFDRKINLMICSNHLKRYIEDNQLKKEDHLFPICPSVTNRHLKRMAKDLFGEEKTEGGKKYSELTMYDLRHISCCYWLLRYKSEAEIMYRFGWRKSDKVHYYSEFKGMKDTISEDDMLIDVTKTEIERKLEKSETEKMLLEARMSRLEEDFAKVTELTNNIFEQMNKIQ